MVRMGETRAVLGIPSKKARRNARWPVEANAARYFWEAGFAASPDFTPVVVAGPPVDRIRRKNREITINPAPTMTSVWVSGRAVSDVMIACTY